MRLHVKLKEFFRCFYSHIIFPCIQCFLFLPELNLYIQ
ncbi:hypothetical protein BANRA_01036 [Escherichia coli]|nr:hypothetical protein BANRA_01036 [Escherichia coli]